MKTDCTHCGQKNADAYTLADSLIKRCEKCNKAGHFGYVKPCRKCEQNKIMSEEKQELKNCPFCGGEAEIERFGNNRCSTIYACTDCGCRLETNEEWGFGDRWNTRAENPRIAALELENLGQSDLIEKLQSENAILEDALNFYGIEYLEDGTTSFKPSIMEKWRKWRNETENAELRAEVAKWKRLAGKKAI